MTRQRGPAPDQQWLISRWLVLLAVAWLVIAVLRWFDDDASALSRWAWTLLALFAAVAAVHAVGAMRRRGRR